MPYFIIFCTGATTLSLELLASRIMTPFFGVSLFIWSGILSITLLALALGYYLGGRLSQSLEKHKQAGILKERWFHLLPLVTSAGISLGCLLYPHTFSWLAQQDLISGSFAACLLLLMLPLLAASAMNPLLISMLQHGGSGKVFFISTLGSVLGVLITAFVFIPYLANQHSLLLLAWALPLLSLAAVASSFMQHKPVLLGIIASVLLAALPTAQAFANNTHTRITSNASLDWTIEGIYHSLYGTTQVITAWPKGNQTTPYFSGLLQGGFLHLRVSPKGDSLDLYPYMLEQLALRYSHHPKRALMLGLGIGKVPMQFFHQGIQTEVVEIDPAVIQAATQHFAFDSQHIPIHQTDARTYVRQHCRGLNDVVVVDLFHGDGVPDYLISRDFFSDLKRCLRPGGIAVFNTVANTRHMQDFYPMLSTLKASFDHIALYHRDPTAPNISMFMVASDTQLHARTPNLHGIPSHLMHDLIQALGHARPINPEWLAQAPVLTDESNGWGLMNADTYLAYRASLVKVIPSSILAN